MKVSKRVIKIVSIMLSLMLCLSFVPLNAMAAEEYKAGDIVEGTLLTSDSTSEGFYRAIARGSYLSSASCNITNGGGGVVYIGGTTIANRVCDSVEIYIDIDRLVNGSWVNVDHRGQVVNNTAQCNYSTSLYVTPGYYYRVTASHIVRKGVVKETASSHSDGILIK
ncbi:DUF6147 family protein [uncultured Robinsoniella sp.]|uniref:DUF6147 family protein n=1 Tax=uncultured Robinsoniella sp. TaxID=904190 RepID=UPI00374EC662